MFLNIFIFLKKLFLQEKYKGIFVQNGYDLQLREKTVKC